MSKYILKRIAMGILSVFIVATLTFFLMNLVPGGPFVARRPRRLWPLSSAWINPSTSGTLLI